MKKLLCLVIILTFVFMSGCQTDLERDKRAMLEIYGNDDNYITLIGEVTEIDSESSYNVMLSIKCEELKQYNLNADDECKYSVFSSSNVNIGVGDTIVYKTIPNRFDYMEFLPIVAIDKNDETILDFEEGKENLISWVKQLQFK